MFTITVRAQFCTGSVGNAALNITFGTGPNFGPPLSASITNLQYRQWLCLSGGNGYTIVNSTPVCQAGKIHPVLADHTGDVDGYSMVCFPGDYIGSQPNVFYVQTVDNLCPSTSYRFAAWLLNMVNFPGYLTPDISFIIKKLDGTILDSLKTGNMVRTNTPTWVEYGFDFMTPPGVSAVVLQVQANRTLNNNPNLYVINYFALDDITFRPVGPVITLGITGITGTIANVCNGGPDSLRFFATVDSCYAATAYQWQESTDGGLTYTDIPGANSGNYTRPPATGGQYLYRLAVAQAGNLVSPNCRVFSAPLTVIEGPPPSVSIGTTAGTVCAGSPATFVATVANSGSSVTYQWRRNGQNVGTNNRIYISQTLANGDTISCAVTNVSGCLQPAFSNNIVVNMVPLVAPGISITAAAGTVCKGSPAAFTATALHGGAQPVYQWSINSVSVGGNSPAFASSTLANGDTVRCTLTSNANCAANTTAVSNYIVMNVADTTAPLIQIVADTSNSCAGTPVSLTATAVNGGPSPVYQWKVNGISAGSNAPVFTNSTFINGDVVSCMLTNNAACLSINTVSSNPIVLTVRPSVIPSVFITANTNNVCPGSTIKFTATIINGGAAPVYQWKINGTNVGTNSAVFTTSTYADADLVTCIITGNAPCTAMPVAVSNTVVIVAKSVVPPAIRISISDTNICQGKQAIFIATAANTGVAPVYQWVINGRNVGSNSPVFSSMLSNGDAVSCHLVSSLACTVPVASNTIVVKVHPLPYIKPEPDKLILAGGSVLLSPAVTGTIASYLWMPPTGLNNNTIQTPLAGPVTTTTYILKITTVEGCEGMAAITVKVLEPVTIPNAFSPNGDSVNDKWVIRNLADYPACTVQIFSRYGQSVFYSKGYNKSWDGTLNGKPLPIGEYYYIVTPANGAASLTGGIMLIR